MNSPRVIIDNIEVGEGGDALLTLYFVDGSGNAVALLSVGTLRFWLDDESTGATINSRANQDIKNLNGGTLAQVVEDGVTRTKLTIALAPADNPIIDATKRVEWHLATVKGAYNGGAGMVPKEILFKVRNLSR